MKKTVFAALLAALAAFPLAAAFTETPAMPATARRGLKVFVDTKKLDVGNYDVTFTFGDKEKATRNWVKFEGRRVALAEVTTKPGETKKISFTARVKGPATKSDGPSGEAPYPYALSLTVITDAPGVSEPEIVRNDSARVVYLCGDSTVTDQQGEPWGSWGQCLPAFFGKGLAVANFARSGLTTKSFRDQGRLDRILDSLKEGDFVLVQFGHNDQKRPELAPETGYTAQLVDYVERIRAKGGRPVIVSSVERLRFSPDGAQEPKTLLDYANAAKAVATEKGLPCIDLNDASYRMYGSMGAKDSPRLLCTATIEEQRRDYFGEGKGYNGRPVRNIADKTHHSIYGAYVMAHYIADRLAEIDPALAAARREGVKALDPANVEPDPQIPPSGNIDATRPEGDTGNKE